MGKLLWTTEDILAATGGEKICGNTAQVFSGIGIDSRTIDSGEFFVAVAGETHDGHRFLEDVIRRGIQGVLVCRDRIGHLPCRQWADAGIFCAAVENTITALGDLARFNRRRAGISVAAITGSNGKTTTRTMTASVVSQGFPALSTQGNFNNEIGLPLTLFRLEKEHQWAVLEAGMNHTGEIRRLAKICEPDIAVITNIGPAHIGELGSLDAIAMAKAELLEGLRPGGTAILNADDPRLLDLAGETLHRVMLFGLSPAADVRATEIEENAGGTRFILHMNAETIPVFLKIPGRFMVSNALAAAAVGNILGLSPEAVRTGLENFSMASGRMTILETRKDIYLVDDTYNANPASMQAAFQTLQSLRKNHRAILVIGDMFELGEHAAILHRKVGRMAAESGVVRLCVCMAGPHAEDMIAGAQEGGMASDDVFAGTHAEITEYLKNFLEPGDRVLVKGSRGMKMENVLNALREWADTAE